jgi:thioredoxin-like negative regulator of GroEL
MFTQINRIWFVGWLAGGVALATVAAALAAKPYIPADNNEVLETLPRDLLSSRDELTTLRRQLTADPTDVELATDVASRYMQLGKQEGDPRFNGYAQAAIGPWWEAANPPSEILKLRAKLKERDHRYDAALDDLKLLLEREPHDIQARIELANIYRVQGKYAEAQQACDTLSEFAGGAPTIMCSAPLLAATGKAEEAYAGLAEILPAVREQWPAAVQWMLTMQAEIARSLGRDDQADQHYRDGLANNPGDKYLLRSYADFLLDGGREEEVLSLLRAHTGDTGILLCLAIAARRSGQDALADDWQSQLDSRFEETRLRGDQPHGRFEARYNLELKNDPQRALSLAQANWQQQKEPHDTRILLEAAIAAKDVAAAQPVLKFVKENGTQDVVLGRLAQQLEQN